MVRKGERRQLQSLAAQPSAESVARAVCYHYCFLMHQIMLTQNFATLVSLIQIAGCTTLPQN